MIFFLYLHLQCHCSGPSHFPHGSCNNFSSAPSLSSQLQPSYPKHKYNNVLLLLESFNDYQLCSQRAQMFPNSLSHSPDTNLYTFPWECNTETTALLQVLFPHLQKNSSSLFLLLTFSSVPSVPAEFYSNLWHTAFSSSELSF